MSNMMGVSEEVVDQFRTGLLNWANEHLRDFPWRETSDPYEVLFVEVLLQKTLADKVPAVYEEFLDHYPDLTALSNADISEIADFLEPLGFQK